MICLTFDIHHNSLGTGNQHHCDITEIQTAQIAHKLISEAKIKATYFITGKAFAEEWNDLKSIVNNDNIEIGGHTYYCFKPDFLHRITKKLFKSYNGLSFQQKWDTQKTIDIIYNKTGKKITSWRNHMYMHGPYTDSILKSCGIKVCSDGVKKQSDGLIQIENDYYHFPINTIPDHEHIIHAERTPEWISDWQKRYNWSDDFGPESYHISEWTDILLRQLEENEKNGVISNLMIHPITMYLCDQFESFKKILSFIQDKQTCTVNDLYNQYSKSV